MIKPLRRKQRRKLISDAYACERIMYIMRGSPAATDLLNEIRRHWNHPVRKLQGDEGTGILSSLAVELFAESNPENEEKGKGYPLGLLAQNLVMYLTGLCETQEDPRLGELGFNLTFALPHLYCYGRVEEMFMELKREARRIDTVGGGD